MPEQTVVLEQLNANDVITIIDSVHSDKNGHFEFSEVASEPGLYRLHFKYHKFILLSLERENVKVIADWNNIEKYNIAGSPASESLRKLIAAYRDQMRDFHTLNLVIDTLKARGSDSMVTVARKDIEDMNSRFTRYIENYSDSCSYLPNAVFAARILNPGTEMVFLDQFTQSLARRFPNTKMGKDFAEYYLKISVKPSKSHTPVSMNIGEIVPEINLPTESGTMVALSSMRGKYVLLDFWASFCPPCREENPNIVKCYNKFKDKNFTIYGISLDDKKEDWLKAVKDDNISWTQVSDLKRWESPIVKLFGVDAIPTNFLIDPTGKIIAKNLRGDNLQEILQNYLK